MEENIMVYKAANMCIIPLCQVSCLDEKFGQIDPCHDELHIPEGADRPAVADDNGLPADTLKRSDTMWENL